MRRIKRISAWILTLAILLTLTVPALAASGVQNEVQGSAAYMVSAVKSPEVGSIGGEWAIIGLARSGYTVPTNYYEDYYARVEKYVKNCSGVLHERKYTEYSRVILALTAIGRDPSKVAGYNLLMPLGDFEKTIWQGLNGPIWALIALDSGNYEIPKNPAAKTQATRQLYIDEILNSQMKDGGWSLTGTGDSDVDISAMALQALAKYQDQKAVKTATDKALTYLSKAQDSKGGYASWGTTNVESVAQVVVALCELGVSLDDSRFVKNGKSVLDKLLTYQLSDGSFCHDDSFEGKTVCISGSGNVAQYACQKATQLGAKVVTLSDSSGYIHDPEGIDAAKLDYVMELKNIFRGRIKEYADRYPSATYYPGQRPWGVKCDIAMPCATQNELNGDEAQALVDNGCICVAEGANMPSTPDAIRIFQQHKLLYAPGKAANAGGVATSGLEMTQNSMRITWSPEEVDAKLRSIMQNIHSVCVQYGTQADGYINYVNGANIGGFMKVANAMLAQGCV